jgi:hypothetical protein
MATGLRDWRAVAVANVRVGALFAIGAAMAGWRLASGIEATSSLEWHRWLGTIAALAVAGAALTTAGAAIGRRLHCGSIGSRCSGRRLSSLLRAISGDCWSGARTLSQPDEGRADQRGPTQTSR